MNNRFPHLNNVKTTTDSTICEKCTPNLNSLITICRIIAKFDCAVHFDVIYSRDICYLINLCQGL